jgi:hypothetical protein
MRLLQECIDKGLFPVGVRSDGGVVRLEIDIKPIDSGTGNTERISTTGNGRSKSKPRRPQAGNKPAKPTAGQTSIFASQDILP